MHDCLIIGAGPAGLSAATYLARYRRDVVCVEAGPSRAALIPRTHNLAGYPGGIAGDAMARIVTRMSLAVCAASASSSVASSTEVSGSRSMAQHIAPMPIATPTCRTSSTARAARPWAG